MIIGSKNRKSAKKIYKNRSNQSIRYAIAKIKESPLSKMVDHVYLYGSCARGTQNYSSDVDLLLQLSENGNMDLGKEYVTKLKGEVTPTDITLPEVDLKVVIGESWKRNNMLYYKRIEEEGIDIWQKN